MSRSRAPPPKRAPSTIPRSPRLLQGCLRRPLSQPPADPPPRPGLENVAVNDLLAGRDWTVEAAWAWKQQAHINVLETKAALQVLQHAVKRGGDCKLVLLLDSSVARGALAKGRSTSRLLRPLLCQAAAWLVAGGIYAGFHHAPTRLNIADDPSRRKPLRATAEASILSLFPPCYWQPLLALRELSASSSGWLRLALLLRIRVKGDRGASFLGSLGSSAFPRPKLSSVAHASLLTPSAQVSTTSSTPPWATQGRGQLSGRGTVKTRPCKGQELGQLCLRDA